MRQKDGEKTEDSLPEGGDETQVSNVEMASAEGEGAAAAEGQEFEPVAETGITSESEVQPEDEAPEGTGPEPISDSAPIAESESAGPSESERVDQVNAEEIPEPEIASEAEIQADPKVEARSPIAFGGASAAEEPVGGPAQPEQDTTEALHEQTSPFGGAPMFGSHANAEDATTAVPVGDSEGAGVSTAPNTPKRRRRKVAVIAGACVALVLGVGAALWLQGYLPVPSPLAAPSGHSDTVTVSRTSRIIPRSVSGETPSHYYVRVRRAVDSNGNEIDVSSLPELEVEGDGGFVPETIISDLPDGTYTFEIDDGNEPFDLPPVDITNEPEGQGEQGRDEGVTIQATPEQETEGDSQEAGDEKPKTADELFLDKINELEDEYGEAEVKVQQNRKLYLSYLSGLAYAELVDFGDGAERLVTMYLDKGTEDDPYRATYTLQVWEHNEETHELDCVVGEDGDSLPQNGPNVCSLIPSKNGLLLHAMYNADWTDAEPKVTYHYYGLLDDGSLGLVHEFVTDYGTPGPVAGRYVDGKAVTDEEERAVREEMGFTYEPDMTQTMYATYEFTAEETARAGTYPDNDDEHLLAGYFYPGDLVELVAQTKQLLQDRIDGKDNTAPASSDASRYAPNDVAVTVREEDVAYPTYNSGATSDGTNTAKWSYVELSGSDVPDDVASSINATLKQDFEAAKQRAQAWNFDAGDTGQCTSYRSFVTCARAGVVCVRVQKYCTAWGPHGWTEITDYLFDLETGKEVTPFDAVGLTEDDAKQRAIDCIMDYVTEHPGSMPYASEVEARADAEELVGDTQFTLNSDGLTVYLPEYAMGYSYQEGVKEIVVWAFDDPDLVGTDVHQKYSEKIE